MLFVQANMELGPTDLFFLEDMPFLERRRIFVQLLGGSRNKHFIRSIRFRRNNLYTAIAIHGIRDQTQEPVELNLDRIGCRWWRGRRNEWEHRDCKYAPKKKGANTLMALLLHASSYLLPFPSPVPTSDA